MLRELIEEGNILTQSPVFNVYDHPTWVNENKHADFLRRNGYENSDAVLYW